VKLSELALEPGLLYLYVFGPGYGESIAIRLPPDSWLVVDSLRCQTIGEDWNPALELLTHHGARASAVALTHPHNDHARGLIQILDRRLPGAPVGRTDELALPDATWRQDSDAREVLDTASVAALLNRIDEIWGAEPASEWRLLEGETRQVGEASIEVLHPLPGERAPAGDLNRISSPMLVSWHECRLLLGADLPVVGWRAIAKRLSGPERLASSQALKVAHHGSKGAQHASATGNPPPNDRACVVTPFNRGRPLPSYADGHGIDNLLRTHRSVAVTSVLPAARGMRTPRAKMRPRQEHFGDLTLTMELKPPPPSQSWIAYAFDRDGKREGEWCGEAAGVVLA
jgi:hypothetical protein